MNDLVKRIKQGREKGHLRHRLRFYRKASRRYETFDGKEADLNQAYKKLKSVTIGVVVLAVMSILSMVQSIHAMKKTSGLHDELVEEFKLAAEMQAKAGELSDSTAELIELVEKNKKLDEEIKELDEEIMDLIEQKLDKVKPKPKPKPKDSAMSQDALAAGLRLFEYMTSIQHEDGSIYCPSCNRKI